MFHCGVILVFLCAEALPSDAGHNGECTLPRKRPILSMRQVCTRINVEHDQVWRVDTAREHMSFLWIAPRLFRRLRFVAFCRICPGSGLHKWSLSAPGCKYLVHHGCWSCVSFTPASATHGGGLDEGTRRTFYQPKTGRRSRDIGSEGRARMRLAVEAMADGHGAWLNFRLEFNGSALALAFYFHSISQLGAISPMATPGRSAAVAY